MNEIGLLLAIIGSTIAAMSAIAYAAARIVARKGRRPRGGSPRVAQKVAQRVALHGLVRNGNHPPCSRGTAILSGQAFDTALQEAVRQARKHGTFLSLIRVEIDPFHETGADSPDRSVVPLKEQDRTMRFRQDVIDRMADFLRSSIQRTDMITRMSDGGFAILTPGCDESAALKLTDTLRRGARLETMGVSAYPGSMHTRSHERSITCCFGVASLEDEDSVAVFRDRAENALRHAQRHGSNRIMGQTAAEATAIVG